MRRSILLLVVVAAASCRAGEPTKPAFPARRTEMLPMRDGVRLATDVYLPASSGRFPVILMRTPYDKNGGATVGAEAQRRGYVLVIQDTRGRSASEGENLPFVGDGWTGHRDGYDTAEWIAAQPWCDGKIGTFGGSALGITQLKLAGSGSDRISTQLIQVGAPSEYDGMVYRGGVFRKSMIEDWLRATRHSPDALTIWQSHPVYDDYWRGRDLTTRWGRVDAPALHAGGWYDIFAQGTLDAFCGYQEHGGPRARGRQKLVIGPWTHGIFQDRAGDLQFPNAKLPPGGLNDPWRWFDHYLKRVDNGIDRLPAVTYYTMGDTTDPRAPGNVWRTADRWPREGTRSTPYYLHADRTLSTTRPSDGGSLSYTSDPGDPVPTVGGPQLTLPAGPKDQRSVEGRKDVLAFTSAPLQDGPLEVTGRVRLSLWIASDAPDTDFAARLCDVYPDGRSMNVCEGILRARFRNGFRRPELLKPGKVVPLDVDFWSTSMVFNRGHRLRVDLASTCAPGYEPNPQTGADFRAGGPVRAARNTVYLDARHPSHLLLPIAPPVEASAGEPR